MQSWSFTWQDSSPRPTRQGVAFNRPLINYPDSIRLHHANHLHASLYARIRATKSERKTEKEPRLGTLIARTSHYLFTRDLRYRSQRAVEPRIERISFLFENWKFRYSRQVVYNARLNRESRGYRFSLKIENFSILSRWMRNWTKNRYFF